MARTLSRFHTLMACAAIAAAAFTTTVARVYDATAYAIGSTWRWVTNLAFRWLPETAKPKAKPLPGLAVQLIAAKQYVMRQIKRERPDVTPGWRMAPST